MFGLDTLKMERRGKEERRVGEGEGKGEGRGQDRRGQERRREEEEEGYTAVMLTLDVVTHHNIWFY